MTPAGDTPRSIDGLPRPEGILAWWHDDGSTTLKAHAIFPLEDHARTVAKAVRAAGMRAKVVRVGGDWWVVVAYVHLDALDNIVRDLADAGHVTPGAV